MTLQLQSIVFFICKINLLEYFLFRKGENKSWIKVTYPCRSLHEGRAIEWHLLNHYYSPVFTFATLISCFSSIFIYSLCECCLRNKNCVESSWNVVAHGDAREGKWRGNWRMKWVASTLHSTSEHGVSSITTADAHTSAASSRLNW